MEDVSFSQQVLADLRAAGYRPRAWGELVVTSWRQSQATARHQPRLVRDWRLLATLLCVLPLVVTARRCQRLGSMAAVRHGWPLAAMTMAQLGDIYVHLGLHRQLTGQHHASLGPAMTLTALRGWVGGWLLTRLVQDQPLSDGECAGALVAILMTDIVDGPLARRTSRASALGRYLDGEADVLAWTALTLTQTRQGQVPRWFLGIFALRWGLPMLVGFGRTFAQSNPVIVAPTGLGRTAGAAHVALALLGLVAARQAHQSTARLWQRRRNQLAVVTAGLFGAATWQHLARFSGAHGTSPPPEKWGVRL
ncbi:MAG: CDP-alcohol phosphatidyltransferase family protein [Ktedonobacterales bacterium]|nr:CDP-alcohol phosphatidyltransferase family protein [Ktedonobacterales bacterium]